MPCDWPVARHGSWPKREAHLVSRRSDQLIASEAFSALLIGGEKDSKCGFWDQHTAIRHACIVCIGVLALVGLLDLRETHCLFYAWLDLLIFFDVVDFLFQINLLGSVIAFWLLWSCFDHALVMLWSYFALVMLWSCVGYVWVLFCCFTTKLNSEEKVGHDSIGFDDALITRWSCFGHALFWSCVAPALVMLSS